MQHTIYEIGEDVAIYSKLGVVRNQPREVVVDPLGLEGSIILIVLLGLGVPGSIEIRIRYAEIILVNSIEDLN
jgi:hypothetical protein